MLVQSAGSDTAYDVIVVGAGPAGIIFTSEYSRLRPDRTIALIEAGGFSTDRQCAVEAGGACSACPDGCGTIQGYGGCLHPGYDTKISLAPCGSRLIRKVGEGAYGEFTGRILREYFNLRRDSTLTPSPTAPPGFTVKAYPVRVIDAPDVGGFLRDTYHTLREAGNVHLYLHTRVRSLEREGRGFRVGVGPEENGAWLSSPEVVMAVGRAGFSWWSREMDRSGILRSRPTILAGVRIEGPREALAPLSAMQTDYKVSTRVDGRKFKTFCFCCGEGGGTIRCLRFDGFVNLDGHIRTREGATGASPGNFSLLTPLVTPSGAGMTYPGVRDSLIREYTAMNAGSPVVQWYPDFKRRTLAVTSHDELQARTGYLPSLASAAFGHLATLFGDDVHRGFCETLESLMLHVCEKGGYDLTSLLERLTVYGLEIENMWDVVETDAFYGTDIPGLHVIGDALGLAQGVLSSMVSGYDLAMKMGRMADHGVTEGVTEGVTDTGEMDTPGVAKGVLDVRGVGGHEVAEGVTDMIRMRDHVRQNR